MNELRCNACTVTFKLSEDDKSKITQGKKFGSTFIKLRCPNCGIRINFNPTDEEQLSLDPSGHTTEEYYSCPNEGCDGLVI